MDVLAARYTPHVAGLGATDVSEPRRPASGVVVAGPPAGRAVSATGDARSGRVVHWREAASRARWLARLRWALAHCSAGHPRPWARAPHWTRLRPPPAVDPQTPASRALRARCRPGRGRRRHTLMRTPPFSALLGLGASGVASHHERLHAAAPRVSGRPGARSWRLWAFLTPIVNPTPGAGGTQPFRPGPAPAGRGRSRRRP